MTGIDREAPIDLNIISRQPSKPTTQQQPTTPIDIETCRSPAVEAGISPTSSQSRRSTPVLEMMETDISPTGTHRSRRRSTPVLETMETDISPTGTHRSHRFDEHAPPPPHFSNLEAMIVKQGKQIRALYKLQKVA